MNTSNSNLAMPPSKIPNLVLVHNEMVPASLTPRQKELAMLGWYCDLRENSEGFPDVDYNKYAELAGSTSVRAAICSWSNIKRKLQDLGVQLKVEPIGSLTIDDHENFDNTLEQRTREDPRTDSFGVSPVKNEDVVVDTLVRLNSEQE